MRTHHHLNRALALSPRAIKHDLAEVRGFNAKVAILITRLVGTVWAFWLFNGIALVSLPTAISTHNLTVLINWLSSNWLQLILLPALMVGQNVQSVAADSRAEKMFADTEVIVDRLDEHTQGGITCVLDEIKGLRADLTSRQSSATVVRYERAPDQP